ncbi:MAG: serine/threonine-protein phosphatase [Butyrivibrio sp.]|nr:serine/threonine-protein phosphatase [Butyrivibrio sp.]
MSEKNHPFAFIKQSPDLYRAGFVGVCLISAMILAISLVKPVFTADISDVFTLSMDILGTVVCSMLYFGHLSSGNTENKNSSEYFFVLFLNTLTFLFDSMMWLFSGSRPLRVLNILASTCFYSSTFILFYLFWKHACIILKTDKAKLAGLMTIQKILLGASVLLCLINFFTPLLFSIDSDGVFLKGYAYPAGSIYILATFIMLIIQTFLSGIEKWRKIIVIVPAISSILAFTAIWGNSSFALSYTVAIISIIIANCILYGTRLRMKELIIRVFSTLLLVTMLIYGPLIYIISAKKAVDAGFQLASDAGQQQAVFIKQSIRDIVPAIVLFFITLQVLNHMIERVFLNPFYTISRNMQDFFIDGNKKKTNNLSVSESYEVWFLSKSFDFMISELDEYEAARTREIQEKQRISTEIELSKTIQSQFLPGSFPPYPDRTEFDIFASMKPAKEVAGDFFDFFFVAPDKLALVIADVSGKGFPAALFMMRSKTVIRTVAEQQTSPALILEMANRSLCDGNDKKMFVTAWLGIIDLKTGVMACSNAGHEYPMLRRAGEDFELFKDPHSPILGLKKKLIIKEYKLKLEKGDCIFVYTDGIPESVNTEDAPFGLERLTESLNKRKEDSMEGILCGVSKDIEDYKAGADRFDDITMLGFKYIG